ncbi:ice-binding family protein [Corallococcus caeni]|uniref:ice-binding family protein n=1 Tax=Corallococcus caeni TaxID=3082388 RepID=UPI0033658B71
MPAACLDVRHCCVVFVSGASRASLAPGNGLIHTKKPGLEALRFVWGHPGVSVQSFTANPRHPSVSSKLAARLGVALLTPWGFQAVAKGPASSVTGDMGVSPVAATSLTGFSLVADATNVFSTPTQGGGKGYAANYAVPTPIIGLPAQPSTQISVRQPHGHESRWQRQRRPGMQPGMEMWRRCAGPPVPWLQSVPCVHRERSKVRPSSARGNVRGRPGSRHGC